VGAGGRARTSKRRPSPARLPGAESASSVSGRGWRAAAAGAAWPGCGPECGLSRQVSWVFSSVLVARLFLRWGARCSAGPLRRPRFWPAPRPLLPVRFLVRFLFARACPRLRSPEPRPPARIRTAAAKPEGRGRPARRPPRARQRQDARPPAPTPPPSATTAPASTRREYPPRAFVAARTRRTPAAPSAARMAARPSSPPAPNPTPSTCAPRLPRHGRRAHGAPAASAGCASAFLPHHTRTSNPLLKYTPRLTAIFVHSLKSRMLKRAFTFLPIFYCIPSPHTYQRS